VARDDDVVGVVARDDDKVGGGSSFPHDAGEKSHCMNVFYTLSFCRLRVPLHYMEPLVKLLNFPFYVYILTNKMHTVLYTGFTNNLFARPIEHYKERGNPETFTGRYNCNILIYFEGHEHALDGIAREKQIKKWSRKKKVELINTMNPHWENLYLKMFKVWPPIIPPGYNTSASP